MRLEGLASVLFKDDIKTMTALRLTRSFLIAIFLPLAVTAIQWSLWDSISPSSWFLFWPTVFFCIFLGSFIEGLVAVFVAAACAWWFFVPQPFTLIKHDYASVAALLIFVSLNVFVCVLYAFLKRSKAIADANLAKVSATHKLLLDALADGIFIAQDFKFVFCNPALPDSLGYSAQEFNGFPFHKVVAPEFLSIWTERFQQRISGAYQPERYYEVQFIHKNGSYVWMELRASVASYQDRPAVLGIVRDISNRKKQEDQLRLAKAVFQNAQEGIAVTDLDRKILATNPAFNLITEYGAEELIGQPIDFLHVEDKNQDAMQQMQQSLKVSGAWQGEIWKRRKSGDVYREWLAVSTIRNTTGAPFQLIDISLDISRMNHVETYMEYMSQHDSLTDLPNRSLLYTRLQHTLARAKRDHKICAVLFMDLDRFKPVNDELGHAAGDEVLVAVARCIKSRVRDIDTVARLGGDEFVVVLDAIDTHADAVAVAQDLINSIQVPITLSSGASVTVGASIGISQFPDDGDTVTLLLEKADMALYDAKRAGRGTYKLYEAELA
jgi:diguanylate cyclase (GGDEF)-like protein/PAS domain S-box-containing protein